jgi:phosphoribosylformylglycinamidine cyclo-ligase
MTDKSLAHVNYSVLDAAKEKFIEAARRTARFADRFGFIPGEKFGASANIFKIDLSQFIAAGARDLSVSLVPEGLGTADDARPDDLTAAELTQFWYNIGIKTVAVMTNDAASSGLQTVLIGLYLPSSTPETVFTAEFMSGFLDGFVAGCKAVGCVYLSGETPQLKTKIVPDKLDIAGALWALRPAKIKGIGEDRPFSVGDRIVLVESSGPHENGFTSLRDLAERLPQGYRSKLSDGTDYWRAINAPSMLYTGLIQALLEQGVCLTNAENITGHGWLKIMRPDKPFRYLIKNYPPILPIFEYVKEQSGIDYHKLFQIFNCGSGLALFVPDQKSVELIIDEASRRGLQAVDAGVVEEATQRSVVIEPLGIELNGDLLGLKK